MSIILQMSGLAVGCVALPVVYGSLPVDQRNGKMSEFCEAMASIVGNCLYNVAPMPNIYIETATCVTGLLGLGASVFIIREGIKREALTNR